MELKHFEFFNKENFEHEKWNWIALDSSFKHWIFGSNWVWAVFYIDLSLLDYTSTEKFSVRRRKKSCGIIQTKEDDQYVLGKFYLKKRRWSICFWVFSSFFFQFAVWDWYLSCILWHYTFMYLGNTPKNNCLLLQVFRL